MAMQARSLDGHIAQLPSERNTRVDNSRSRDTIGDHLADPSLADIARARGRDEERAVPGVGRRPRAGFLARDGPKEARPCRR